MRYQAAIFDLDGTLLDTLQDLADTCNQVLAESGFPQYPVERYRYFVGDGLKVLIERIVPIQTTEENKAALSRRFAEIYAEKWQRNSCPYPGINAMLAGLKNAGIRLGVLSNKMHAFTQEHVAHFFPGNLFEIVLGQRPGVDRKPSPAGLLEIASAMGLPQSACLYIGDTAVDMQTGRAAGMFTVGVLWGFRERNELALHQADIIVQHPMEIVQHAVHSI